jgi:hypothetical protein
MRVKTNAADPKHCFYRKFNVLMPFGYRTGADKIFFLKIFLFFFQEKEIDYCHILNRNLPDDIKVTAWAPCPTTTFRCLTFSSHKEYFDLDQFFPKAVKLLTRSGPIPGHNLKASFFGSEKFGTRICRFI